jgi:hypothetical protein
MESEIIAKSRLMAGSCLYKVAVIDSFTIPHGRVASRYLGHLAQRILTSAVT